MQLFEIPRFAEIWIWQNFADASGRASAAASIKADDEEGRPSRERLKPTQSVRIEARALEAPSPLERTGAYYVDFVCRDGTLALEIDGAHSTDEKTARSGETAPPDTIDAVNYPWTDAPLNG